MEIRTLEINFDRNVLKINGNLISDKAIIVTLPGPEGWKLSKLFNPELQTGAQEECDRLDVHYIQYTSSNKP